MTTSAMPDMARFKASVRDQWDHDAAGWNANTQIIRAWLCAASQAMLVIGGIAPGMRVLDVAAGAGDQTLDIARRVGPHGSVLATDLSPAILALAKMNAKAAGLETIAFKLADGEDLKVPRASFDAVICRLGLMFFPDPGKGLAEMFAALRPGGTACTLVFSSPAANPCIAVLISTARRHAGLPAGDPYQPGGLLSLGKPGLIASLFGQAGFSQVTTTGISAPFRLPTARHYLAFIKASASPILNILAPLDEQARDAAWEEMEVKLQSFATAEGWEGPNELLLTVGRKEQ